MTGLGRMLRTRAVWPAMEAELQNLGVDYRLTRGGKHPAVRVTVGGQSRRIPLAGSPRSHGHSVRKAVCQVRRVVSQMRGAVGG